MHPIKDRNVCYVAHQGIARLDKMFSNIHDLIRWPESGLTMTDLAEGRKFKGAVLTENPWIISNYRSEDVYVWEDGRWTNPDRQTYGASVNSIMCCILGIVNTIPGNATLRSEIEETYQYS